MTKPTTANYNPIDTKLIADALVPTVGTPTSFIAQDIKQKEIQPDLTLNPFGSRPSLFGTAFNKEPRALRGYANEYFEDANQLLSNGEYIAKYESYIPGVNNEERLARQQTTGEKWTNGTLKLLGKTGTAILGGTIGVVDSLVEGVAKGSLSEVYNTKFNNWLDDLNTKMDYKLPNYYTEQEKSASLLGQTTQANFWADKVFGGLSFTLGALVSEGIWGAATGGVGLLTSESQLARLAKWTVKGVGGESKALSSLNAAKKMAKGSTDNLLEAMAEGSGTAILGDISEQAKNAAIRNYKFKKLGDIALVATRSAGYESGMEARHYMNSTEHAWLENYYNVNGTEPTAEEYAQFKDGLTNSANAVFGANMIIVGGSNIAQFGNALLGKSTNPALGNNILKRNLLGIGFDKTITTEGKIAYKALEATKAQKIAGKAWGVLGAAIPESQEEMLQSVASQTAENYILSAYDPNKTKSTYGVAEAFTDALNTTYGSKEGWSEGLVGAIVGVLGAGVSSRFKFGEVSAERENIKRTVDFANKFTAENHINNVIANNKLQQAQENKEKAALRGDIVGEELADVASTILYTERNAAIGNTKEAVKDLELQFKAISDEDLAVELGLDSAEEAKNFKEQKLAEFKDISDKHEKNLNYAQALLGETEIAGVDKIQTRELVRAMAITMTLGSKSMQINQNLVNHVKNLVAESVDVQGATDAMDVQQVLDLAPKEKTLKLSQLNLQLFHLNNKEKELLNRQFEASKLTDAEDNKARQNALIDINQEIADIQKQRQEIAEQKQLALDAIGIKNYTDASITVDMFDNQNANLDKLRSTLESIEQTNPERYNEIRKALEAQSMAISHIKQYQKTINQINDPKGRVKVLNGWLSSLMNKNTKLSEGTEAYFADLLENVDRITKVAFTESQNIAERNAFKKGEEVSEDYKKQIGDSVRRGDKLHSVDQEIYNKYKEEIDNNAVSTMEAPQTETKQEVITPLQTLKDKVKEIISSNDYLTKYFGSDLAEQGKTKPSEEDIKGYEDLLSKIDRRVEPNISKIVTRPTGFYKGIGLTDEELDRFKELQTKLNDWLTLEGTFGNDNQSVAQMLELIDALETTIVQEDTKTELEDRDYKSTVEAVEDEVNSAGNLVRGLQTATSALVNIRNGNMRFSHISVQTLASFFYNTKEEAVSNVNVNSNNTFEITLPSGKTLKGRLNERGGQDVNFEDWKSVQDESNVLIKDFGTKFVSISRLLGTDSQGNEIYQNVPSDFDYQQTNGENLEIDKQAVNNIKNGDTLDLFVSPTDAFNAKLSDKELQKQIHIYVMKDGKLLGSLPAPYIDEKGEVSESVEGLGMTLADLRKDAARFSKNEGKKALKEGTTLIKLPQKMTAKITFMGAPNITLQKDSEGNVTTKNNPFNEKSLQSVVGQGFIENGEITTTASIDVKQFIRKISSANKDVKIPFVVFNYNKKAVAFPVSLNSETSDKAEGLFDGAETTAQKQTALINALIENRLDPQSYKIDFTDTEGWGNSPETLRALDDLSNIKETVSLERFASKNYNKQNLTKDATIAIDITNEPFQTNKIMLSSSSKIDTDVLGYKEHLNNQEEKENGLRTELNTVAREVEIRYSRDQELDNKFTQTFDENPLLEGDSDVIKRHNINILRQALKGASKKTKEVIGLDLYNKAVSLLKELDSTVKNIKDIKEEIKNNPYYQEADSTFITIDENGNIKNPAVNQSEAINELGGIKNEEAFKEKLSDSNLDYLKTADQNKLFEDMSEFNDVPVKTVENGQLVDKLDTAERDALTETIDIKNAAELSRSTNNLNGFTETTWNNSYNEIKVLLDDVVKKALDSNIDLREAFEGKTQQEVLSVLGALDVLTNDNVTEADLNNFIDAYLAVKGITEAPKSEKVKVEDKFKDKVLVALDTQDSEYKTFKEQGLVKIQDGVYIKTDGHLKTLEEVENLAVANKDIFNVADREELNKFVDERLANILTEDAEYNDEAVKKLIYFKTYFGAETKNTKTDLTTKLSKINPSVTVNASQVISETRNKQLREEHPALKNLIFNQKGITLKYTDQQSVDEMNEYLKENEALKNYFLISKNTNFEVEAEVQEELISERDRLVNGEVKEQFKGDYRVINNDTIQAQTNEDFITIGTNNYERVQKDFFAKLDKNTSDSFTLNNEQPVLNINTEDYTSVKSEAKTETSNQYNKEEGDSLEENNSCIA